MYPHYKIYQVLPKSIRLSNPRCYIAQTQNESPRKFIGADLKQQIPMYSHMLLITPHRIPYTTSRRRVSRREGLWMA